MDLQEEYRLELFNQFPVNRVLSWHAVKNAFFASGGLINQRFCKLMTGNGKTR